MSWSKPKYDHFSDEWTEAQIVKWLVHICRAPPLSRFSCRKPGASVQCSWPSKLHQSNRSLSYFYIIFLSDCSCFLSSALEKEMAIYSSTIAWKIPWTEKPGRLQPMGSQRVRHDWATSLSFHFTFLSHCRQILLYHLNHQGSNVYNLTDKNLWMIRLNLLQRIHFRPYLSRFLEKLILLY